MNIMNQLTKKHMKTNRKRTLMTILGVIISVAMITAVSSAASSFTDLLQRRAMNYSGAWHVRYKNLPVDDISDLENENNVRSTFYTKSLAYGKFVDTQTTNENKPYLYIEKLNTSAMTGMSLKLTNGRFPTSEFEILLPEHLEGNGGLSYEVGDRITLDVGDRYIDDYTKDNILYQTNPYVSEEGEDFSIKERKTYEVVGTIKRPDFEEYTAPGYTAITFLDMTTLSQDDSVNAYVFAKNVTKNIYSQSKEIAHKLEINEDDVSFNERVIRFYGISQYDEFNLMINGLAFILILIIMIGSVSLIYNSFAISITERSKQFGMLASVGATKQQKRNSIFYEGILIGVIAIPLGIIAGILGMAITFRIVGPMLTYSVGIEVPLTIRVSSTSIVIAILFSMLTIFISALIPAKRASRISPIEAIRQTKDIKLQKKAVKTSRLTRYLFGIEGELAQKNLKRNKKRYRALVFSLFISLILFISVGSYVFYLSNAMRMSTEKTNYDLSINFNDNMPSDDVLDALRHVEGVREGTKVSYSPLSMILDQDFVKANVTKQYLESKETMYRSWGWSEEDIERQMEDNGQLYVDLITLDETSYANYVKQVGAEISQDKGQIPGILINKHKDQMGYSIIESDVLNIDSKDELSIYYQTYEEVVDETSDEEGDELTFIEGERIEVPIELIAVTEQLPLGLNYSSLNSSILIVIPEDAHLNLLNRFLEKRDTNIHSRYSFVITKPQGIEERLKYVLDESGISSYSITNRYESAQQNKQLMTVMSVFAYGFIALISLICMTNLCNTISTSFALRRREFAMLKSVGMTPKSFNRMIRYESLLYGLKALLYGLPVSLLITYKIYEVVNSNFSSNFTFPWVTYLVGVVSVFLVVGVAMAYSSNKVKDESIIDGLKSEIE